MKRGSRKKQQAELDGKVAQALAAQLAGNQEEARRLCEEVLAIDEQHAEAQHLIGVMELDAGRAEEAERRFAIAILGGPKNARFHCDLGRALHAQHRNSEAERAYQRALRCDSRMPDTLVNLGNVLYEQDQYDQAFQQFRQANLIDATFPHAHYGMGLVWQAQKEYREAAEAYERAVEYRPDWGQAHNNLGRVQWQLARKQQAVASFRKAAELLPQIAAVTRNLAEALFVLEEWDESRRQFERVLELEPGHSMAQEMVERLRDGSPKDLPDNFVRDVFDNYADWFDTHLTSVLKYRAPQFLRHAVEVVLGPANGEWKVVDLGCGTGLCGQEIAPWARELIGSDLSSKMVEQARSHEIYHDLRVENLTDTLHSMSGDVDLIVAGDVLIYVGELDEVMQAAAAALRPGGAMVFSTEREDNSDKVQMFHVRYRHPDAYVCKLAAEHQLNVALNEPATIRFEGGEPVPSQIYLLVKGPVPQRVGDWNPEQQAHKTSGESDEVRQLFEAGLAAHRIDQLDEAEAAYRKALKLDPRHAKALNMLGALEGQRGNRQEAIRLIRESIASNPRDPASYNNLGNELAEVGELEEAAEVYRQAIRMAPFHAHLFHRLSTVLLRQGEVDEADECVQQALRSAPGRAEDFREVLDEIARRRGK